MQLDKAIKLDHLALGAAGTRMTPEKGLVLSPKLWGWSPKIDGALVRLSTDAAGRIATMLHRSGARVSTADADGLLGQPIGLPDSVLVGELECHTEAGIRARQARGWAALHLFDVERYAGRSVAQLGAFERYHRLQRWQALTECYEPELGRLDWWNEDDQGRAHDPVTGRYVVATPRDLRRLPIVPLHRGKAAAELLWSAYVERDGGEGVVAVRLDAPLGARGSKRKIKASETIDATVVSFDGAAASLLWRGHRFAVSARCKHQLAVGAVVECQIDGWYEAGVTPRFPRITRVRGDLATTAS